MSYLEVTDTGCGMSKETVEKIFDPFYTTKFTGRGLGLSALLGIIRGHKGAIRVYSEKGKGTTMKILLPCSGKPAESVNYRETSLIHAQLEGTVLLVDDEETVRIVAKDMLEECGLEVLTACDGREAVDLFRTHQDKIALVLLDMTMPHMDGEETFREIKRMDNEAQIILLQRLQRARGNRPLCREGACGFHPEAPIGFPRFSKKSTTSSNQTAPRKSWLGNCNEALSQTECTLIHPLTKGEERKCACHPLSPHKGCGSENHGRRRRVNQARGSPRGPRPSGQNILGSLRYRSAPPLWTSRDTRLFLG